MDVSWPCPWPLSPCPECCPVSYGPVPRYHTSVFPTFCLQATVKLDVRGRHLAISGAAILTLSGEIPVTPSFDSSSGRPEPGRATAPAERAEPVERADVTAAAAGDALAFERLYRRHSVRIHNLARRMIGAQEADELTQDIFVRAWQKLSTFRGESAFGTWLYRLGVNLILERRSWWALHRSRHHDDAEPLERVATAPVRTDLSLDFETAIATLPPGAREVFVLHDIEGHKHREIAGLLGISAGTSKGQLHRARMLLRGVLK